MRVLAVCTLLVALAGCDAVGPEPGDLALRLSSGDSVAGTEVGAVVANESARALYLYDCGGRVLLDVQRQMESGWETVASVNNDCATEPVVPYRLDPGEEERSSFLLRSPGIYRLRTSFGTAPGPGTDVGRADWLEAVSESFAVTAP